MANSQQQQDRRLAQFPGRIPGGRGCGRAGRRCGLSQGAGASANPGIGHRQASFSLRWLAPLPFPFTHSYPNPWHQGVWRKGKKNEWAETAGYSQEHIWPPRLSSGSHFSLPPHPFLLCRLLIGELLWRWGRGRGRESFQNIKAGLGWLELGERVVEILTGLTGLVRWPLAWSLTT